LKVTVYAVTFFFIIYCCYDKILYVRVRQFGSLNIVGGSST